MLCSSDSVTTFLLSLQFEAHFYVIIVKADLIFREQGYFFVLTSKFNTTL